MKRYQILDEIRGITLCSMILYHTVWDLVYMFGCNWRWFYSDFAYWWQQSICWSFIFLSGFCFSMGKRKWRRGLLVLGAGTIITIVTHLLMPAQRVRFGVLTFLGVSMLFMAVLEKIMKFVFVDRKWGLLWKYTLLVMSAFLFFIMKDINFHHLGFEGIRLCRLPDWLYKGNDFTTFLGFTESGFFSTDYFSFMPWFFLFACGYCFYHIAKEKNMLDKLLERRKPIGTDGEISVDEKKNSLGNFLACMGRHSLVIYMFHQPVIYGILYSMDLYVNSM